MRLGPGPVFVYEWLATTRRRRLYALRAAFVVLVLIAMMLAWYGGYPRPGSGQNVSLQMLAAYGQRLFHTIVTMELSLVLLAAPAATAGAVCLDKARGTLDHVLATDLSNTEIVLGKLGARLIPVLGLIVCLLPLFAITSLLGGIDPTALLGSFLTSVACAVLGCSLALALSVWGRKTHEVLLLTYLIIIIWLAIPTLTMIGAYVMGVSSPSAVPQSLWDWVEFANPYYLVFSPYYSPGKVGVMTFLGFLGCCLFLSGVLVALAAWRIRAIASKTAGHAWAPSRRRFGLGALGPAWLPRLPGPSLDGNPVLWREWQRFRPSRFLRVAWFLYSGLGVIWMVVALKSTSMTRVQSELIPLSSAVQVSIGLLLLSVSAATSLAEERARGSLDILLSTPLSTYSILIGKWWGAFRLAPYVIFWPALLAGILVFDGGSWFGYILLLALILAYSMAIASLGLALATWVSRLGRAVAICVSICIVFSIGWIILVASIFGDADFLTTPLIMGSPLYGPFGATLVVAARAIDVLGPVEPRYAIVGALLWIVIHSGAAALLFGATVATFDHCMGRIPEDARPPGPRAGKKPSPGWKPTHDDSLDEDLVAVEEAPQ